MNNKDVKLLRGQVRIAVKEMLPEILKHELLQDILNQVMRRLSTSETMIKNTLEEMNNRSKEIHSFLVRQSTSAPSLLPLDKEDKRDV